eukprot:3940494-Rhodomonas_salina.1
MLGVGHDSTTYYRVGEDCLAGRMLLGIGVLPGLPMPGLIGARSSSAITIRSRVASYAVGQDYLSRCTDARPVPQDRIRGARGPQSYRIERVDGLCSVSVPRGLLLESKSKGLGSRACTVVGVVGGEVRVSEVEGAVVVVLHCRMRHTYVRYGLLVYCTTPPRETSNTRQGCWCTALPPYAPRYVKFAPQRETQTLPETETHTLPQRYH